MDGRLVGYSNSRKENLRRKSFTMKLMILMRSFKGLQLIVGERMINRHEVFDIHTNSFLRGIINP